MRLLAISVLETSESRTQKKMDDIYTFGMKHYVPAAPVERSIIRTLKNILFVLATSVKCTVFGVFLLIKSFVLLFVPLPTKNIQNQVALVRTERLF